MEIILENFVFRGYTRSKFRLRFFNLGWFSISFSPSPNYSWIRVDKWVEGLTGWMDRWCLCSWRTEHISSILMHSLVRDVQIQDNTKCIIGAWVFTYFLSLSFFPLDIDRTFPDNIHFTNRQNDLRPALYNVLVAYAKHNPRIGYCQVGVIHILL